MWGVISFGFVKLARIIWLTAETDWYYDSVRQRCRNILIGSVVRAGETVVVLGKSRISTQNRKNPEMTVLINQFLSILIVSKRNRALRFRKDNDCRMPFFFRWARLELTDTFSHSNSNLSKIRIFQWGIIPVYHDN